MVMLLGVVGTAAAETTAAHRHPVGGEIPVTR